LYPSASFDGEADYSQDNTFSAPDEPEYEIPTDSVEFDSNDAPEFDSVQEMPIESEEFESDDAPDFEPVQENYDSDEPSSQQEFLEEPENPLSSEFDASMNEGQLYSVDEAEFEQDSEQYSPQEELENVSSSDYETPAAEEDFQDSEEMYQDSGEVASADQSE
jgi:hypothetical protein